MRKYTELTFYTEFTFFWFGLVWSNVMFWISSIRLAEFNMDWIVVMTLLILLKLFGELIIDLEDDLKQSVSDHRETLGRYQILQDKHLKLLEQTVNKQK